MKPKLSSIVPTRNHTICLLAVLCGLGGLKQSAAQPMIISTIPANMATGVSGSAAVVFTFSTAMDTAATSATFLDSANPITPLPTTPVWSAGNTVLTCTPGPAFPSPNHIIIWSVTGQDTLGTPMTDTNGFFTTGTGSGGGGSGTNATTTFTVGKLYLYDQYSTGAPTPDTNGPYTFVGSTALQSNRTANTVTLTIPTGGISNLTQTFGHPESFNLFYFTTISNQFATNFPQGAYTFNVYSTQSNQTVGVTLPLTMTQPNAPHITDFTAAQSVNASQAFLLSWDPFVGAGSTDVIYVVVGNWKTPDPGTPNALAGTSTSVSIPAGTLSPGSNYLAQIGFYHIVTTSNAMYRTAAYRASATQFSLQTLGTTSPLPVVTNATWSGGKFGFDIETSSGQTLTVVYSTNSGLPVAQWSILGTTNSPGTRVHIIDPQSSTTGSRIYRARNGL